MPTKAAKKPSIKSKTRAVKHGPGAKNTGRSVNHGAAPRSKVQVYGRNKRNVLPIETDKYGRLLTVPVLRKRKRMPRTKIYGTYQKRTLPIRVDRRGRLETHTKVKVHVEALKFHENRQIDITTDKFVPLPLQDISHALQYVYLVRNMGEADAEVFVEVGTDHESLARDLEGTRTIRAKETTIITPLRFSKFIRLLHKSATRGKPTKLFIVFQTQVLA